MAAAATDREANALLLRAVHEAPVGSLASEGSGSIWWLASALQAETASLAGGAVAGGRDPRHSLTELQLDDCLFRCLAGAFEGALRSPMQLRALVDTELLSPCGVTLLHIEAQRRLGGPGSSSSSSSSSLQAPVQPQGCLHHMGGILRAGPFR